MKKDIDSFYTQALEADNADTLSHFRDYFQNDTEVIYLDGNSLGKLPKKTIEITNDLVQNQWGKGLIRSWNEHWIDLPNQIAAQIAKLIGARADEVFVGDSTSLNLYKLAFAALTYQSSRKNIVTDSLNFPTDLYIFQGLLAQSFKDHALTIVDAPDGMTMDETSIEYALDTNTALLSLSHVVYKSAFMYDMKRINAMAHEKGALVLWDLSHAAGAVPVNLNDSGADMAVGCTYKYLNGGPGAPAFLYVRKELQEQLMNPVWGWFSHDKPFDFSLSYEPKASIQRFAVGTPSVLSLAAIQSGLSITLEADMTRLREKSIKQSTFLIEMIQQVLVPEGFSIASPLDLTQRGSHVSIQHAEGYRISKAMIEPFDGSKVIIPDFRPPNNIRLGIAPLYNSYEEIYICVERLLKIVQEKQYEQYSDVKAVVT